MLGLEFNPFFEKKRRILFPTEQNQQTKKAIITNPNQSCNLIKMGMKQRSHLSPACPDCPSKAKIWECAVPFPLCLPSNGETSLYPGQKHQAACSLAPLSPSSSSSSQAVVEQLSEEDMLRKHDSSRGFRNLLILDFSLAGRGREGKGQRTEKERVSPSAMTFKPRHLPSWRKGTNTHWAVYLAFFFPLWEHNPNLE